MNKLISFVLLPLSLCYYSIETCQHASTGAVVTNLLCKHLSPQFNIKWGVFFNATSICLSQLQNVRENPGKHTLDPKSTAPFSRFAVGVYIIN